MYSDQSRGLLVLSIIAGLVGGILIFVEDFAGWYTYHGGGVEEWGYVAFDTSGGLITLLYLCAGGGLLCCAGISAWALMDPEKVESLNLIRWGRILAISVTALILVGGMIFISEITADEPDNWWFGAAFYGGAICGALSSIFLFLVKPQLPQDYRQPPQEYRQSRPPSRAPRTAEFCPQCGNEIKAVSKFCMTCGHRL